MIAFCWATGVIEFGRTMPDGAIEVARGGKKVLQDVVSVVARHAYDGKTLLVPGVPDAADQEEAGDALFAWLRWCASGRRDASVRWNAACEHIGVQIGAAA